MSTFHNSMWAEASRDHAAEGHERAVALSSVALAGLVPFLHAASSIEEYEQRLALVQDRAEELLTAHTADTLAHTAALSQVRADFEALHQTRVAARLVEALSAEAETKTRCAACNERIEKHNGGWRHTEFYSGRGRGYQRQGHDAHPAKSAAKTAAEGSRPISEIADDIQQAWPNVYFGAVPYLNAMKSLTSIDDMYYEDSARSVLTYFLSNASGFRGEQAKALKNELKAMLGRKTAASEQCEGSGDRIPAGQARDSDVYPNPKVADATCAGCDKNFSGLSVDSVGMVKIPEHKDSATKTAASDDEPKADDAKGEKCWDCGGTGTVPDMGEGDNGQEKCPTCGGSGTLSKTGARVAAVPPFSREALMANLDDITDEDVLEAEGLLETEGLSMPWGGGMTQQQRWEQHHADPKQQAKDRAQNERYERSVSERTAQPSATVGSALTDFILNEMEHGDPHGLVPEHGFLPRHNDPSRCSECGRLAKNHAVPEHLRNASLVRTATVKCAKCTAGSTPDGAACGYCDGAGALDATMAMIKAADGWDQGITAQSFLTDAVDESAKGTDRYQKTTHPSEGEWVHDEWDEGKADQKTLDTGRAGKDRGLPAGEQSTKRTAYFADMLRLLNRLSGKAVSMTYTSDYGVDTIEGTLIAVDDKAHVVTKSGVTVAIPAYNVMTVEPTGYSDADPGAGSAPDREPGVLDWMGNAIGNGLIPSGATATRRVANPYASNPYAVDGPGSPNADNVAPPPPASPEVTPPPADPKTTRPRVAPAAPAAYDPEAYPSSPEENKHRVGPVDRSADTLVVEDSTVASRVAAVAKAKDAFTAPPRLTAREAKVGQITAAVLTSNPGMGVDAARAVAEATVARYAGVAGS